MCQDLGTHPICGKQHLSDKWNSSAPCVFKDKFEKHSTTISPRSDCDVPSLHFNPSTSFFFLIEQFVLLQTCYVSHSRLPLHGFAVKSV